MSTHPPSLGRVLRLAPRPGLLALDLGPAWTLLTWTSTPAWTGPTGPGWPEALRAALRPAALPSPSPSSDPSPFPFAGGLIGWWGYEGGRWTERMPSPRTAPPLPEVALWRTEGALYHHRPSGAWSAVGAPAFCAEAEALLRAASAHAATVTGASEETVAAVPVEEPLPTDAEGRAAYLSQVEAALGHIRAGDVYQVNLAWEVRDIAVTDPLGRWLALREQNPALRGAYIESPWGVVLSNSPELFLEIEARGGALYAKSAPIKGTAPASAAGHEALTHSEKERAELTMITDLVRNDLGRVARAGSVEVSPRALRACGDLLHAEQEVRCTLREDRDSIDAFIAAFPPGSVTGAPKVRAMEVIRALEAGPRGVYTGAIGFFADGGAASWSVAIRTATVQGGLARFHVGAGIVADSRPAEEWEETLAKGRALYRALRRGPEAQP
jgi:para-aminobenzoate synthetase component 1